jgi:clan AA aspartic protease
MIDTGFNGDLELPERLRNKLRARYIGPIKALLAGGQSITQEAYDVLVSFDGKVRQAEATFVDTKEILIGTRFLRKYRLEVDFVAETLLLERASTSA